MPEINIPLARGEKTIDTADWVDQLPVNMFYVNKPVLGYDGYMSSMPGQQLDATFEKEGGIGDRGGIYVERESFRGHYRVINNSLLKINETEPDVAVIGAIPGDEQCPMAYSFNNLAIVADQKLYYYNPVDGLRQITDPDVGQPIDITWVDSIFVLTDGETIYHSEPLNEEAYDPLDFATAEFRPDPSYGVAVNEDSELLVFGSNSIEYYRNVGAQDFTFARITQKAQKIGVVGTQAKGTLGNAFYILGGRDNSSIGVHITEAGASKKISSISVDKLLTNESYTTLASSIVEVIELDGTELCFVHMPNQTLMYNRTLAKLAGDDQAWSIVKSADRNNRAIDIPYDAFNFVRDKERGLWLFGSRLFGNVYRYRYDSGDEKGVEQECILYSPLIKIEQLSIDKFECENIPGFGKLFNEFGINTTAFISLTYDGVTYGKEWSFQIGEKDNYNIRFLIRRLGYVRDYVGFRIRVYSQKRIAIAGAKVEVS